MPGTLKKKNLKIRNNDHFFTNCRQRQFVHQVAWGL